MINKNVQKASLFLFNKFVIKEKCDNKYYTNKNLGKYGLFFNTALKDHEEVYFDIYLDVFPYSEVNNTFWNFYQTIKHEKDGTRILHQIVHYLTTYGAEALGIKDVIGTYIPNVNYGSEVEGDLKNIKLIGVLTLEELKDKTVELLNTPKGLSNLQIEHILTLVDYLYKNGLIQKEELLDIQNRDLLVKIFDYLSLIPLDFDMFLHYAFQKHFNSRKIKSKALLNEIKRNYDFAQSFVYYLFEYGESAVIEIAKKYRRNKDILLSIKTSEVLDGSKKRYVAKCINRAKKLSDKGYYEPIYITTIRDFNYNQFKDYISKAKLSDLIRYLIYFRKLKNKIRGYIIRNGKVWVDDQIDKIKYDQKFVDYEKLLNDKIISKITKSFGNIHVHPRYDIALPTSMTQFIGNVPVFSTFHYKTDEYKLIGVHWFNTENRVDLDLHTITLSDDNQIDKVGWNSRWGSEDGDIIFSGDMTDAPRPHGAAEYVLIDNRFNAILLFTITDYTTVVYNNPEYQFNLIFGKRKNKEKIELHEYLTNKNAEIQLDDIEAMIPINFKNEFHQILGFYFDNKFIFCNWSLLKSRVASLSDDRYIMIMKFIKNMHRITPKLNEYFPEDEVEGLRFEQLTTDFWTEYFKI